MKNVTIEGMSISLSQILTDYSKEVAEKVKFEANQTALDTVKKLKQISPKKTGKYAKSWKLHTTVSILGQFDIKVYNEKGYLTHLLEFGHGTKKGTRTKSYPHIKSAELDAISEFEKKVVAAIGNI